MRVVYDGVDDIRALAPGPDRRRSRGVGFRRLHRRRFLRRHGAHHPIPHRSRPVRNPGQAQPRDAALDARSGRRFTPNFGRQAYHDQRPLRVLGRRRFWSSRPAVRASSSFCSRPPRSAASRSCTRPGCKGLIHDDDGVTGVRRADRRQDRRAFTPSAVVLACGGFEGNAEWRPKYLGPGWDLAKVRGSRFNTGDGLQMALDIGAQPFGHWSGCHAVSWERYASDFGDLNVTPTYQRHSYPLGMMVNTEGKRFVDEGADFRNYTYAKYGHAVLAQPGQVAWQIYDAKMKDMLRERIPHASGHQGRRQHDRGTGRQARRGEQGPVPQDRRRVQRLGEEGQDVRSEHQGRPRRDLERRRSLQLGEHHRSRARSRPMP